MNHLAEDHPEEDRPRRPPQGGSDEAEIQSKGEDCEGQRPRQKATQVRRHAMILLVGVSLLGPGECKGL